MQKVREESSNLYFNAESPWRWCEFSAHPRVMAYADRTGAELTDIRVRLKVVSCVNLFSHMKADFCASALTVVGINDILPCTYLFLTYNPQQYDESCNMLSSEELPTVKLCPLYFALFRWVQSVVTCCLVSATPQNVTVERGSYWPNIWETFTPSTTSSPLR